MLKFIASSKLYFYRSNNIFQSVRNFWYGVSYIHPNIEPGVYPYPKRQVNVKGKLSFAERMKEIHDENKELMRPIDIGLPLSFLTLDNLIVKSGLTKSEMESAARNRTLQIDLSSVATSWDTSRFYMSQKCRVIEHYGIFNDLFEAPHYFHPIVNLHVTYGSGRPVYLGNSVSPEEANKPPTISFDGHSGMWTVLLTCPDEHLANNNLEYIHWMYTVDTTCNSTKEIIPYLPPIPPKGTGFHRYVFLLFKHGDNSNVSYDEYLLQDNSLDRRSFSTYEFYKKYQDDITPAGLSFFQSEWDASVRHTYHTVLNMEQPQFEFSWPREYRPPQKRFPGKKAFDKYLDKYRDVKDINEEILKERLKLNHPFNGPPLQPKYPNAINLPKDMPSWLKQKEIEKRLRRGIYKDLP